MRIKKKDVILEAQLIDLTTEFTPQEKRMLKTLNKKFGKGGMYADFDRWDGAAFLIEEMELPYDQAYDLALTYWWYGDKLFEEAATLYRKEDKGYIFNRVMRELLTPYIKGRGIDDGTDHGDKIADVSITWEDPEHLISKEGAFTVSDDVTLWDGHKGFTLYIPFNQDYINGEYVDYKFRNLSTIMVYIEFIEYDEKNPKGDTHVNINITYTIGDSYMKKDKRISLDNFDIPMPIPMTKEKIYKIFTDMLKDTLDKIESMTFTLQNPDAIPPEPEEETQEEENTD